MKVCKPKSRRGGAAATIIGFIIFLIVIATIANVLRNLLNPVVQSSDECGAAGATSVNVAGRSTVLSELRNSSFWAIVRASAQNTTQSLLHDTVLGYIDKDQEWRKWSLQYVPGAAEWADGFGPYINAQLILLQARALASGNVTAAFGVLEDQVSRASGVVIAGVDFLYFNGASVLRTYFETGSPALAYCASYPSELQQLWDQAFNPNLTEQERAHYLGQALAISGVTLALARAGGFSDRFKVALDKVGLADSWDTIKPYLGKIGSTVSAKAAHLTFTLLQKLAQRFPKDRTWVTGLTSDRTASMAELLSGKGFSKDAIEQRITKLIQAAGSASNEDDIAAAGDATSLRDGGGIVAKVASDRSIYLFTDGSRTEYIQTKSLKDAVPGFVLGKGSIMELRILKSGAVMYSEYHGGARWEPSMPSELASPGDELSVGIHVLTTDEFVKNLSPATLANEQGFRLMPTAVELSKFRLSGDMVEIQVTQELGEPASTFSLSGRIVQPIDIHYGDVYLQVEMKDYFGQTRDFKIHHDGHTPAWLGIEAGSGFPRVSFLTFDGVRLRVVYVLSQNDINIAKIYLGDPSILYTFGEITNVLPIDTGGAKSALLITKVTFNRQMENSMLGMDSDYVHGRLGAEIAYSYAKHKLGLTDVVLAEISKGGKDLYTADGKVVIQARFLTQTKALSTDDVGHTVRAQLNDLVTKLRQDFQNNKSATTGYAVLSYLDNDGVVKTIVVEVAPP